MGDFFMEGGWGMYPVLVLGAILVVSAARYAIDGESARLRFVVALSLSLVASIATACTADVAKVFCTSRVRSACPTLCFFASWWKG